MRQTRRNIAEGAEVSSTKENESPPHITGELNGQPKSILTPGPKDRGERSGKNVAFEVKSTEKEMDLGFKDIPTADVATETPARRRGRPSKSKTPPSAVKDASLEVVPDAQKEETVSSPEKEPPPALRTRRSLRAPAPSTSKPPPPKPKAAAKVPVVKIPVEGEESSSEEEDDELCAVCQNGDSEPPNEILFCDNCDRAFHQKCCDPPVLEVPEDDWLCKDCDPELLPVQEEVVPLEELMNMTIELPESIAMAVEGRAPDIEDLDGHLRFMQNMVLEKLMGRKAIGLVGLEEEFEKVYQLVEQTVVSGEGNSMLIIGSRGCGKTMLVEKVISDLSEDNRENFHVVRLNGFIHTDDKLALRDIWRQLGREMEVEEDLTSKTNNYADTLASLLALLSHPDEISAEETGATAKSVVFILDEFDLFAQHARQTLLYNLFDIAQARKAPIAVLGVATKLDVVEALEKRLKSRFSHRYVHLPLPKSFAGYKEICRQGMTVDPMEFMDLRSDTLNHLGSADFIGYWEIMIEVNSSFFHPPYHGMANKPRNSSATSISNNTSSASSTVQNPSLHSSPQPSSPSPHSLPPLCLSPPHTSRPPYLCRHQIQNSPYYLHYQPSTLHSSSPPPASTLFLIQIPAILAWPMMSTALSLPHIKSKRHLRA